jgi:hypothetical protein
MEPSRRQFDGEQLSGQNLGIGADQAKNVSVADRPDALFSNNYRHQ